MAQLGISISDGYLCWEETVGPVDRTLSTSVSTSNGGGGEPRSEEQVTRTRENELNWLELDLESEIEEEGEGGHDIGLSRNWWGKAIDGRGSKSSGDVESVLLQCQWSAVVVEVRGYNFNSDTGVVELLEIDSFRISVVPSSLVWKWISPH
ncbi:hypothetical protein MLD38_012247 [Melastoma candidum]|uniref:Uncharacterized protein n=1 Tax=Melastoma candidum TaxID=119954 RepID=A0ACB9R5B6_9MYRT|nr:hypothetical protein MLD38_012247 [Melastoma candidum]